MMNVERVIFIFPHFLFSDDKCKSAMALPTLDNNVICYIPETCTGVRCCVSVEKLARSFSLMFEINDCGYRFTIGIENLVFTRSLFNFQFGKFLSLHTASIKQ